MPGGAGIRRRPETGGDVLFGVRIDEEDESFTSPGARLLQDAPTACSWSCLTRELSL